MATLALVIIIYIAFISLGLPDSMLGAAWPVMYLDFNVPISSAGYISMIVCLGTVISSINYSRISKRFSTGTITAVSVVMTALALLGFSFVSVFPLILLLALVLGLGAGAVDAGLNNYVALHFKARAMCFLHAFWGLGTIVGPFLLSYIFSRNLSWRLGYLTIGSVQLCVSILLFATLFLWKGEKKSERRTEGKSNSLTQKSVLKKPGAIATLIGFFSYCSMENTAMLWSATFLVSSRGFSESFAAQSAGLLFWGMTIGRIISGIISERMGDRKMIAIGEAFIAISIVLTLTIPEQFSPIALFLLGLGFGPIYPSMIHQTPEYFGEEGSSAIIGLEMASAYVGSMFMPPIFGAIGRATSMAVFPLFLLFFLAVNIIAVETKRRRRYQ